jgi:hypothetical protein
LAPANKAKVGGVDRSTTPLTACLLSFRPTACGKPLELDFSDSFLQSHQSCYILLQNIQERFSIRLFQ